MTLKRRVNLSTISMKEVLVTVRGEPKDRGHKVLVRFVQTEVCSSFCSILIKLTHVWIDTEISWFTWETCDIGDWTEFIDADAEMWGLDGYRGCDAELYTQKSVYLTAGLLFSCVSYRPVLYSFRTVLPQNITITDIKKRIPHGHLNLLQGSSYLLQCFEPTMVRLN